MIMTEEEAKNKWCPMSRTPDNDGRVTNRAGTNGEITRDDYCIASACMMWRWETVQSGCTIDGKDDMTTLCVLDDPAYTAQDCNNLAAAGKTKDTCGYWQKEVKELGFCGLGGKP